MPDVKNDNRIALDAIEDQIGIRNCNKTTDIALVGRCALQREFGQTTNEALNALSNMYCCAEVPVADVSCDPFEITAGTSRIFNFHGLKL